MPERRSAEPVLSQETGASAWLQGYEAALQKLSEYIVVSRRDVPIETLMDPQYEGLVRQNMRMLMEQAQVAMLSGNPSAVSPEPGAGPGWVSAVLQG
jgi:uroporphyrin-3 C-methyltransferase